MSVKEYQYLIEQAWFEYDHGIIQRDVLMERLKSYVDSIEFEEGKKALATKLRKSYGLNE